jgi:hypothetical protein
MTSTSATTDASALPAAAPNAPATGGLSGALGGLLKLADPQLLVSVGAGLMSGARYGSNAGEGILQGLQSYHQAKTSQLNNQLQQQQIQQGQLGLQRQQMLTGAMQQAMGGPQQPGGPAAIGGQPPQAPPQGAQPPFMPGVSPMPAQGGTPQAAPPQTPPASPQGLPAGLQPPTMDQIYGTAYPGGMDPRLAKVFALGSQDPNAALNQNRSEQIKLAQQQYAPTIARLDQLIKSDQPAKYMNGTGFQDLKAAWPQLAQTLGMDPDKDYNDQNVRLALSHVRNQLTSSLQEPTSEPPAPLQTSKLPDGRTVQIDPVTGKQTVQEASPLEKVVQNGQPTLVPAAQAAGMTPFNQSIFGAGNVSNDSREMAYQYYLQHQALPPGFARSPAMQADMMNFISSRAKQDGNTQTSILAESQQNKAMQGVLKDYTSGQTAKTINGLNTSIQHMAALDPVIDAMGNGNLTLFNKASNYFKQQTGNPAPTNFAALKEFVSGEVAKAVLPGGGGEAERKALADPINAANSPEQLKSAVQIYKTALAGKTDALRQAWDVGTNGTQGDFNKFLLPETKKALGITDAAPGKIGITLNPGQSHAVGGFTVTRVN